MQKKHTKVVIASLLAAAMTASAAFTAVTPLAASAAEVLGEGTFDYKILPWHLCTAAPAKQNFDITEGAMHIQILVPEGEEKAQWDMQFRYRNLEFKKGHQYKVSFTVKAKRDGMELCSHIGQPNDPFERYFELDQAKEGEDAMHMGPDMGGQWGRVIKLSTEYQTYSGIFTPTRDIEGAEWTFLYAKDSKGYGGNAQEGDELWFDNMSIECLTCDDCGQVYPPSSYGYVNREWSRLENNYISVNQVGYFPDGAKIATLGDNAGDIVHGAQKLDLTEKTYTFELVNAEDDSVVYTGTTGEKFYDADSHDNVCKIDFSAFQTPGSYYLRIKDQAWRSFPFRIAEDLYAEEGHDLLQNTLNYFYQNRSGSDIEARYITSGEKNQLAHNGGHKTDQATVQKQWQNEYRSADEAVTEYGSSRITANRGWYNAEDYSKQMVEGGMAVWTLQNMYERAIQTEEGKQKFRDESGLMPIPETGNLAPDILDECKYELDFMGEMKVDESEPTWGEYAGLYYHKLQDHKWIGLATKPWIYESEWRTARIVKPPTFAATLNYAACAAQAARLWKDYAETYSAELMQNAKDAYQAFKQYYYAPDMRAATVYPYYVEGAKEENNEKSLYAPRYHGQGGAPYADLDVTDDAYWAACELYITAKDFGDAGAADYLKDLTDYKGAFKVPAKIHGGENMEGGDGTYTALNWGNTAAAGSFSLALHQDLLTDAQKDTLKEEICKTADDYAGTTEKQGYGIPYLYEGRGYTDPTGAYPTKVYYDGYEYGSNALAVSNMIAMAYAFDLTDDPKYLNGMQTGMGYLLGNNPLSFSYITGYGDYSVMYPQHKFWSQEIDKTLPKAPDGVLVAGSTVQCNDEYIRSLGFDPYASDNPSQRCYVDSCEAWSCSSTTLSWNAALAWVVSFLQEDHTPLPAGSEAVTTEPQPGTTTTADPASGVAVWGDTTADGKTDVSDAVLLARYLTEDADAVITDQGRAQANIIKGKLDSADLTAILMLIAKKISVSQLPLDSLPTGK